MQSDPLQNIRKAGVVRWGIIGCGDVCEVKNGPGLYKSRGSKLVAVMRRSPGLAEDFARRHSVPKWYTDADALIADPEIDAVYVATAPGSHCDYALRICAAGKPAYIEKPMARNATECDRMVRAFAEARLPLFVAFYRRGLPRFLQVKQWIDAHTIGDVTSISCRYTQPRTTLPPGAPLPWRLQPAESGGGLFHDLGSHTLDMLDFIFGPLQDISGIARNSGSHGSVEDTIAMSFRTSRGIPGTGIWNFASFAKEDTIQISGTKGRITLPTFFGGNVQLETESGTQEFELPYPQHVGQPLIQTVVDDLLGRGECPSTGVTAARTARVMDHVLSDYYGGRDDDFWLRPIIARQG